MQHVNPLLVHNTSVATDLVSCPWLSVSTYQKSFYSSAYPRQQTESSSLSGHVCLDDSTSKPCATDQSKNQDLTNIIYNKHEFHDITYNVLVSICRIKHIYIYMTYDKCKYAQTQMCILTHVHVLSYIIKYTNSVYIEILLLFLLAILTLP